MKSERDEFLFALMNCASEPIHVPGQIQSKGALMVVSADLSQVLQASANLEDFLGVTTSFALGKSLASLVGFDNTQKVRDLPIRGDLQPSIPTVFEFDSGSMNGDLVAEVHRVCGDWVIELEPSDAAERQRSASLLVSIRDALWQADAEQDQIEYCRIVADQMRVLTGFDRVMVYRFDQDWNGEVVAESGSGRLPSLMGHHFPAADIPAQARDLYTRNLFRALADTDAAPVGLEPAAHPMTGRALDMSYATLRSMSPVHIDYLRNMGARASMSISLMVDGKLWGLIACHHAGPRSVPFDVRGLAMVIGTMASLKLTNLESSARSDFLAQVQQSLLSITREVGQSRGIQKALSIVDADIRGLFKASGSIVGIDGRRYEFGEVPSVARVDALITWLNEHCESTVCHTDCLRDAYPAAGEYTDVVAGLLAVRLDDDYTNFSLWFRKEAVRSIPWAGEPRKSLVQNGGPPRIEPRRSFARWVEEQRGHSAAWTDTEAESAHAFTQMLTEVLTQTPLKSNGEAKALLRAQSLQSDINDAAQYLRSVLPEDLTGPVSAASRYLPSRTLGGDCFDFRWLDDDHFVFYLLDVSGHGVRSALVAVSVHNMLRSSGIRPETLLEPDQVLAALNTQFAMDSHDGTYLTIWFGVYQRSTRTLRYSVGGHPPALLFSGATHTKLAAEAPPVGMFDGIAFPSTTLTVEPGSRILLYTDGAYELPLDSGRQATHNDFVTECRQLAESPDWSLDELLDGLRRRSVTNSFDDDCCLVAIKFD